MRLLGRGTKWRLALNARRELAHCPIPAFAELVLVFFFIVFMKKNEHIDMSTVEAGVLSSYSVPRDRKDPRVLVAGTAR